MNARSDTNLHIWRHKPANDLDLHNPSSNWLHDKNTHTLAHAPTPTNQKACYKLKRTIREDLPRKPTTKSFGGEQHWSDTTVEITQRNPAYMNFVVMMWYMLHVIDHAWIVHIVEVVIGLWVRNSWIYTQYSCKFKFFKCQVTFISKCGIWIYVYVVHRKRGSKVSKHRIRIQYQVLNLNFTCVSAAVS